MVEIKTRRNYNFTDCHNLLYIITMKMNFHYFLHKSYCTKDFDEEIASIIPAVLNIGL